MSLPIMFLLGCRARGLHALIPEPVQTVFYYVLENRTIYYGTNP